MEHVPFDWKCSILYRLFFSEFLLSGNIQNGYTHILHIHTQWETGDDYWQNLQSRFEYKLHYKQSCEILKYDTKYNLQTTFIIKKIKTK